MRLQDKIALITGGARGIGAACAEMFAREGAKVAIADRRADEGQSLCAELNSKVPGSAIFVEFDISNEDAWAKAVTDVESSFGKINVLVNNAGMIRVMPFEKTDVSTFKKVVDTNLLGTFLGMKAVLEGMKEAGGGSIINFSSVQGLEGREGLAAYSSTKFGIRGLTKTTAIELGPYGIRVNTVIPGPTRTKMTERPGWTDEQYNAAYGKYPLGRMASASEVANVALFLASDESSFCTGGDFAADGGVSVGKPRV
ncbi:glucose 1-dehydrogenase [Pseudomaricurvus alkylphenolicus]|uniref:SDR family NAD(P)-dependent oxidoreductase n=1 Tax=Pseudomaricurvus alkylphenolicus TaxID=1306991 RepID=UPI001421DBA3|nr:glucose 1-dehydrogenase [Pseudomaricurvus alkylphenolicus]NIB40323.1 glucose 1-dehydrogenase [Pseudomaricurvus alkylphenolicus]